MKKVISIFLSVLLLVSSSGIAYAQHFCGDYEMLSEVTLGEKHLSCGMTMTKTPCANGEQIEDPNCCDNQFTQIDTDDNFAKANFDIQFNQHFVAALVSVFVLYETLEQEVEKDTYFEYQPPPLVKDIAVLYETFLI
ncbi:HYC_CC_PP family protein [Ulvibacter antarcticus]|uniref:Secreted protein n=1 Tax=Ulvibacter antarcticus TaxID=442714 RepID=A0A3L9Z4X3_9FLAO|nr:hypothetical protein [Ulvibacter antarcticus]RMA66509.1 hypothetical protein BXY75_0935 [Ulvibacter antarcticus]